MTLNVFWTLLLLVPLAINGSEAFNILLLPLNINSHYGFFGRIGEALVNSKLNVSMLAASNAAMPPWLGQTGIHIERYKVPFEKPYYSTDENARAHLAYALAKSRRERQQLWDMMVEKESYYWTKDCEGLMEDKSLFAKMNQSGFDLVVTDGTWPGCTYAYPYKLSVPHASFSLPLYMLRFRVPSVPSVYPSFFSDLTDKMSLVERLFNLWDYITENFPTDDDVFIQKYVPEKPVVSEQWLARQSKLWFYLDDVVFDYPKPSMPNTIDIGDIMARDSQPLSWELDSFVSSAPDGAIFVSFGSWFDILPEDISIKFFKAFSRIKQRVVWKFSSKPPTQVASNIKLLKWAPQNDLLGHSNMKLFITHCGLNSLIETVYHGVPIIGFPLTIDQPRNAKVAQSRRYALLMDISDFTEDSLVHNIGRMIEEPSFEKNVDRLSRILKDKPENGSERVSYWVNHVIKFGDSHLRTHAHDIPIYQYLMLDILALFLIAIIVVLVCFYCLAKHILCWCFKPYESRKIKKS